MHSKKHGKKVGHEQLFQNVVLTAAIVSTFNISLSLIASEISILKNSPCTNMRYPSFFILLISFRKCETNQPTYSTFDLGHILNINTTTNPKTWADAANHFGNFSLDLLTNFQILSPALQFYLQDLSVACNINMTELGYSLGKFR